MNTLGTFILTAAVSGLVGCSSLSGSSGRLESTQTWKSASERERIKMAEFVDQAAAVYRRFGQDAKAQGYRLVFTDVGPESLQQKAPDVFSVLLSQASGSGVRFRGYGDAVVDSASVRDKRSGEKGVCFLMIDRKDDGRGGFDVTGGWYDRFDKKEGRTWHDVKYHLSKGNGKWKAE